MSLSTQWDDPNNCCIYAGLLRELWEDLRYIFYHTKKDIPKTFTYIASFGPEIQYEILDIIAHVPEEKSRYILCDQEDLRETLRNYLSGEAIRWFDANGEYH